MTDPHPLVAFLRADLDRQAQRVQAMLDHDWPREVWVTPADMQGWQEGEFVGSVSVHEYSPKRYARINAARLILGDPLIDHGWVVHDSGQLVWSEETAHATLARVEAERRVIDLHWQAGAYGNRGTPFCAVCGSGDEEYPTDWPCVTLRALAAGHRYSPGFRAEWLGEDAEVAR